MLLHLPACMERLPAATMQLHGSSRLSKAHSLLGIMQVVINIQKIKLKEL
jgi:hypothetical protein